MSATQLYVNGAPVTNANPLPVTGGGGGGSSATATVGGAPSTNADSIGFNDATGNLAQVSPFAGLPIIDGYSQPITTTWDNTTVLNTAFTIDTRGYDTAVFTVNPTGTITGGVMSFEVYDGSQWVAIRASRIASYATDATVALSGIAAQGWTVNVAGFPTVRVRLTTVISGTSPSITIAGIASSAPDVSIVTVGLDPTQALPPGNNTIGYVNLKPSAGSGKSSSRLVSAASTNATLIKAGLCAFFGMYAINTSASARYVKVYSKASAPTVGTDTPIFTFLVKANDWTQINFGDIPVTMLTGLACAITGGAADSDTTAVAAGDIIVEFIYV